MTIAPESMPGPLERSEVVRQSVARKIIAVGQLFLLLIGLIDATVFVRMIFRPDSPANAIMLALGVIGASSALISVWTLIHVRRYSLGRLFLLSALSALFAALGWPLVMGAAH